VPVNTKSAPQTVTLTSVGNVANVAMTIKSLTLTGSAEFTQTNTCGASPASGQSCMMQAVFAPTLSGKCVRGYQRDGSGRTALESDLAGYGYWGAGTR
jgi:hypothetical protein